MFSNVSIMNTERDIGIDNIILNALAKNEKK